MTGRVLPALRCANNGRRRGRYRRAASGAVLCIAPSPHFLLSGEPVLRFPPRRASPLLIKLVGAKPDFNFEVSRGILRSASVAALRHLEKFFSGLHLCFGFGF